MPIRDIIVIDEEKCDGCGKCVSACDEGAIAIIDGKAKLVKEFYCDGLGNCIGECPQGAITIERREAPAFIGPNKSENNNTKKMTQTNNSDCNCSNDSNTKSKFQCPGSAIRHLASTEAHKTETTNRNTANNNKNISKLSNWPVQLKLIPINAPYLQNSHLLIAADCVCCVFPDFHKELLDGKILIIACPKLDDAQFYLEKLTQMFKINKIEHITISYMEVPCCTGLVRIIESAINNAQVNITLTKIKIGINGNILGVT